jgi:hypothetical protein
MTDLLPMSDYLPSAGEMHLLSLWWTGPGWTFPFYNGQTWSVPDKFALALPYIALACLH